MHFQPRLYRAVNTRGTDVIRDRVSPAAGLTLWRRDSFGCGRQSTAQSIIRDGGEQKSGCTKTLKYYKHSQIPAFYTE